MVGFDIRHVVPSSTGRRVLLGAFENHVVVHDLVSETTSAPINTTFDFGGSRLALSDELDGVVAAAYYEHRVAFYSVTTGQELWRRKDIGKVQQVTLSRDGTEAYCGIEGSPLQILDLQSGETRNTIKNARAVHHSKWEDVTFVDSANPRFVDHTGRLLFKIKRVKFAVLDIAFAPCSICIAESTGPVRCLETKAGTEIWRHQPPDNSNVIHLGYDEKHGRYLGIEWPFKSGGTLTLIQFSADDGTILGRHDIGEPADCCFALSGGVLVTGDAEVLDSETAKPIRNIR